MKLLIAIAHYGNRTREYIDRVMDEYRAMPHEVRFVILSNIPKDFGSGDVDVLVGVPAKNPWSMPFTHKKYFADRVDEYDLFIYSEDDVLVTERNLDAFLEVTPKLRDDEIAGFIRYEQHSDGTPSFEVHSFYRWDPSSVRERGGELFACFTNEHAAYYILTRDQLRRAIDSGGYVVEPYSYRYDLLCTAATDPYTSCGMTKLICLTRFDDFAIRHLPNKYLNEVGMSGVEMSAQIDKLKSLASANGQAAPLFQIETRLPHGRGSKMVYIKPSQALVDMNAPGSVNIDIDQLVLDALPTDAKDVLVIGCGDGRTEAVMLERGLRVTALPVDSVVAVTAARRGIEVIEGDFVTAAKKLGDRRFDCVIYPDVLQLAPDPTALLRTFKPFVKSGGSVIVTSPNLGDVKSRLARLRGDKGYRDLGDFAATGVHPASRGLMTRWLRDAGLRVSHAVPQMAGKRAKLNRATLGLAGSLLADRWLLTAHA